LAFERTEMFCRKGDGLAFLLGQSQPLDLNLHVVDQALDVFRAASFVVRPHAASLQDFVGVSQ
jgi:hypothetical protein